MIQELVKFGEHVPEDKRISIKDGSLTKERVSMCLAINEAGEFQGYDEYGKVIETEVITDAKGVIKAKQGSARFLLDKCEEVLGVTVEIVKIESFKKTFQPFKEVKALAPIFKFYTSGGLREAIEAYLSLGDDKKDAFITFTIESSRLLENDEVIKAIKEHINKEVQKQAKRKKQKDIAFMEASFDLEIVIDTEGKFLEIKKGDKQSVQTEVNSANNNKTFFLIGKSEDVLGITDLRKDKKHRMFLEKLEEYRSDIPAIEPVFKFYDEDNEKGLKKAISASVIKFGKDCNQSTYNITFMVGTEILLCKLDVKSAIIQRFKKKEEEIVKKQKGVCSICGKSDSPILDEIHGTVLMPNGQKAGSSLVSYNNSVFMSYGLKGNLNSSICRKCARQYMEGLNFLMTDGHNVPEKDKQPAHYQFHHRINISDTTVALFWTQKETEFNPLMVTNPPTSTEVVKLFGSIWNGESKVGEVVDSNMFYSLTLSSAAARISVRDWTAISIAEYKKNIADWFEDIEIDNGANIYSPLYRMVNATFKASSRDRKDPDAKSRIGPILWYAAIKGRMYKLPIMVLQTVLNRLWVGDYFSTGKAAVIKLVINRNTNKKMKSTLDENNTSVAYLCGRLFAHIESMQRMAIGKVNSGIKERFFAAAAQQPAYVFGILLTKNVPVYERKVDKKWKEKLEGIAKMISKNGVFPQRFAPIEQGEFALGYYYQKARNINDNVSENNSNTNS